MTAEIHKAHFTQTQALLYVILHENSARREASDVSYHLADLVGEEAWHETANMIVKLVRGLELDKAHHHEDVDDGVWAVARTYTSSPRSWTMCPWALERMGTYFWEEYTEAVRAAEEELGEPAASVPPFLPRSRLTGAASRGKLTTALPARRPGALAGTFANLRGGLAFSGCRLQASSAQSGE